MGKKAKLILKGISEESGQPFKREIRTLDEVRESGQYTLVGYNVTENEGLPPAEYDDCNYCFIEALLSVTRNSSTSGVVKKETIGQTITISNREDGGTNIYNRSWSMGKNNEEWTPWLMIATGNMQLVAQNNDVVKAYTEVSENLYATLERIEKAEDSISKNNEKVLEYATVRFDRIEENVTIINAGEADSVKEVVYYKPSNIFVAVDSSGAYWDTWNGRDAYMRENAIYENKLYICGNQSYIWDGTMLCDVSEKVITLLQAEISRANKAEQLILQLMNNIKPVEYSGTVFNSPDEEDITQVDNALKLKDRPWGDGMGYVILRKNTPLAEQFVSENTIYEVRYDFDLGGSKIIIPQNCVLKFEGGCLENGKINYDNTQLDGEVKHRAMIEIKGIIKNSVIDSDNFDFVNDIKKIDFLFNQIKDNTTIIINGTYNIDCQALEFNRTQRTYLSGRTSTIISWKKYGKINNLKLIGNAVINFSNCPTTRYEEVLYFSEGLNNSLISMSVNGDTEYYKTGIDYGLNFLRIVGDSENLQVTLASNHLAMPFYFGDYYGNDGLTGLINSNIVVKGEGNKYGSRISYARNCNIFVENSYGHRGLYLGGGISHCRIRTECKYMDTSAAVLIGNTYVNNRQEGANNLHIEIHEMGTVQSDNYDIVPARVYINSHGGTIDNGISMRDYSIVYSDIDITATYSPETYVATGFMPFIITAQGHDTGRELVPKDIKKVKCTAILCDGAMVEGKSQLSIYATYDGRNDNIELEYEVVNNSSNKALIYSGDFAVNNDHKIIVKTDARLTPFLYRRNLPNNDWLITKEQYNGTFKLIFKENTLYTPAFSTTEMEKIEARNEALPEYMILENVKAVNGKSSIPQYTPNLTLYKNTGTTSERPIAVRASDEYFDTTLGKLILWSGGKWVNVLGEEV